MEGEEHRHPFHGSNCFCRSIEPSIQFSCNGSGDYPAKNYIETDWMQLSKRWLFSLGEGTSLDHRTFRVINYGINEEHQLRKIRTFICILKKGLTYSYVIKIGIDLATQNGFRWFSWLSKSLDVEIICTSVVFIFSKTEEASSKTDFSLRFAQTLN